MTFRGLSLAQFSMLFGAMALALLAIYLLRYRRRGRVISSNLIWARVIASRRTVWSEIASFLLHLLFLFLICFALTDPAPASGRIHRRYVAVVVDSSQSMGARQGAGTRMDLAAEKAWSVVESLREVDRAMVVQAGAEVRAVTGFIANRDDIKIALETIRPQGRSPRIAEAVEYVKSAFEFLDLRPGDSLHMLVFTDRPGDVILPPMKGVDARVVGIGTPLPNTGVVAFDVRKPFNLTGGHELMVKVANFGDSASKSRLVVYTPEATVGKVNLALEPGEQIVRHYFLPFGVQGRVTALLQDVAYEKGEDALISDNAAFAFIQPQKKIRVLLVTEGNVFLKKALSLNPQVALRVIKPGAYSHGASYGFEVVILDDFTPKSPPAAHALYIHPAGKPFAVSDKVEDPAMTSWEDTHPLLRYIKLNDLTIEEARPMIPAKGDAILAGHYEDALILAKDVGGKKVVGIGFSLRKSDLPLRVAFPILIHNAVTWFAETDDPERRTGFQVGETIRLPVYGDPSQIPMITPQKDSVTLYPRGGFAAFHPDSPGFYEYNNGRDDRVVAVSLVSPGESDLKGAQSDGIDPFQAVAGEVRAEVYWPYLVLLAFVLMLIDFWLFNYGKLP